MENIIVSAEYNTMAPIYNLITQVVSMGGNARAQRCFLKYVTEESRVLTIGCGSIGFNAELAQQSRHVTAIDIAPDMIRIAGKKIGKMGLSGNITFICSDIMAVRPEERYDIVMANFFLNTFAWNDCVKVIRHMADFVKPGGLLCIADETTGTQLMSKVSLFLFRPLIVWLHHVLARQPFHNPYDYTPEITGQGFDVIEQIRDSSDYILSTVYRKK